MAKLKKRILIVAADSGKASFYSPGEPAGHLIAVHPELTSPGHEHARDLKSDREGRTISSSHDGLRHGLESRHDPLKMQKHHFVAALADLLDSQAEKNGFDTLVVVAPKRTLGELRSLYSARVRERLGEEIAKDLTHHDARAIWEHVAPYVNRAIAGLAG